MATVQRLMDPSPANISSTSGEASSSLASPTRAEVTEIIYGTEGVIETVLHAISLIKESLDIFMDITSISIITSNERLKDAYVKLKDRGVKIRNITEITIDSLPYLKKMMSFAEVRHIDGITGSFGVSERDYISNDTSPTDTISQRAIHSTMKVFVQQHQYLFDTIWKNAIPAEQKIQEIENGIKPIATRLLEDPDEIFNHMKCVIENASTRLLCSSSGAMQMVYDNFFDLYKRILDKHRQGRGKGGIRWITTIEKDNKDLVKAFLNTGVQIRHLRNLPPMNFAVDNRHFHGTIENMEGGKMMRSLLTSNEPIYVNYYNSIFEDLWKNGIDAVQRIREIEEGSSIVDLEVCSQLILGVSSRILSQLDNKTAIMEMINRNVKQYTALRICHSYRWNQEYVNFRMECKPE